MTGHHLPRAGYPSRSRRSVRLALLGTVTVIVLGVLGCARTARLASTWRDPGFQDASLTRLLIVAGGRSPGERRVFEDAFASALRAQGVDAQPSYLTIADSRMDSAVVDAQVHRSGCDGIFVTRVVDRRTVRQYYGTATPGYYGGHGYYGPPSAYHAGWWPYYSLGGAYTASRAADAERVSVETNLYRHDNGRLVWSGISRQWLTSDEGPGDESTAVVRELVAELVRSGVIRAAIPPNAADGESLRREGRP